MTMPIEKLLAEATPRPWFVRPCSNGGALLVRGDPDASRPPAPSAQMIPEVDTHFITALANSAADLVALKKAASSVCEWSEPDTEINDMRKILAALESRLEWREG